MTTRIRHVVEPQQFDRPLLEDLFKTTDRFRGLLLTPEGRAFLRVRGRGKTLIVLFYEASTRTRMSFEMAGNHLGMHVVSTENAADFSSAVKGETLEDTIRVLNEYSPDAIVIRHKEEGAAARAAEVSRVPIINAGDGRGVHPTQAFLDVYTAEREIGHIDGITVAMVGDLANGRTARSFAYLLGKYSGVRIRGVSPPELAMRADITDYLRRHNIEFSETTSLEEGIEGADILYLTRIQRERMTPEERLRFPSDPYRIGAEHLKLLPATARILHPLPRIDEIATEVDSDPRAVYFKQAGNGMYVRMALLDWVCNEK